MYPHVVYISLNVTEAYSLGINLMCSQVDKLITRSIQMDQVVRGALEETSQI